MSEELAAESGALPTLVPMRDADDLRAYLDGLNESGIDHRAAGIDANGQPFLIALSGCYADTEVVIHGDPWDTEVDYGTGTRCDECNAANLHGMDSVRFPAWVAQGPTEDGVFGHDPRYSPGQTP